MSGLQRADAGLSATWTFFEDDWHTGDVRIMGPRTHACWLGSMVFDGARAFEGVAPDLDRHCARVNQSAVNFKLKPVVDAETWLGLAREGHDVVAVGHIDADVANNALNLLEVDHFGLDEIDQKIMRTVLEKFGGGPVGVNTIAASVGEEPETIEEVYEPYLIQLGFLHRSPRGRIATEGAYEYFKVPRRFGGIPNQPDLF